MSYPINVPIVCTAVLTTLDGAAPYGVTLTVTDPNNVQHAVSVAPATTNRAGTTGYRGYFVPTVSGNWTRTWAGANVLTTSVAILTVA